MNRVTIEMKFSSSRRLELVAAALLDLADVRIVVTPRLGPEVALVKISSEDPDYVEIVRELCWEFDPAAEQRSILVDAQQLSA